MIHYAISGFEKVRGFMGHDEIKLEEAMLFVDIGPNAGFHMRTVGMDLGIAALDKHMNVIDADVMKSQTGGWTTPEGTAHVLEMHPEVALKLRKGSTPNWKELFGEDLKVEKLERKVNAQKTKRISDLLREIKFEIIPEAARMIEMVDDVIDEHCDIAVDDSNIEIREKNTGQEDAEYYGEPILSDDLGPLSMAEIVVEESWPGSSKRRGEKLLIELNSIRQKPKNNSTILHYAKIRANM